MLNSQRPENCDVRIMSSNVFFDPGLDVRSQFTKQTYYDYLPDVIGLQEISKDGYTYLIANIMDKYNISSAICNEVKGNYTPIVYLKDKFNEIASGYFKLRSTFTYTKSVTWIVLEEKSTSARKFAVCNIHAALILKGYKLEATDKVEGEQWRVDNAAEMLETKEKIIAQYGDIPVFFTGDFNTLENSPSYKRYIEGGMKDAKYNATISSSQGIGTFHSVGKMPLKVEELAEGQSLRVIDFIYFTPHNVEILVHKIITDESALNGTDHCPILVDAKFI